MKLLSRLVLLQAIALGLFGTIGICQAAEPPVNIIYDTDLGNDCDDAGDMFVLHGAVERGEANLLAVMGCTSSTAIAPALDAINIWFGRPNIPVGTLKDPGLHAGGGFANEIAKRYPSKFATSADYPDAVTLYRQVLVKQPDNSVVILALGTLRNLANLLNSGPDAASPLNGIALVAQKVKRLELMGGKYPPFESKNDKDGEFNFIEDPVSAALVCSAWPTPVLFNGDGGSVNSGRRVTYEMPEHNPLTMAYTEYPGVGYGGDRLSWGPISALVAVRGPAPFYDLVTSGTNVTDPKTGINKWTPGPQRGHSYLVARYDKAALETALEDLMVAGKGRPINLKFNTAYYHLKGGTCQITSRGEADASQAAIKAFDLDDKTAWIDKAAASWIQCQYAEGRKYRVTSYTVVAPDSQRFPATVTLSGSNDGGVTWTLLDTQKNPGLTAETPRREFTIAQPAKWNIYRLNVTATNAQQGVQIASVELNEWINCRPEVAVASVTLDQKMLTLPANTRATLNATLAPMETYEREVKWVSSDPAVADVRRIGEQVAVVVGKKPGTCTLTATVGNQSQTCDVTVTASTLPAGWNYDELSDPPIPGSALMADGKLALAGCGHAIKSWWERVRDQGLFINRPATGDIEISARLLGLAPNVGGPAYTWDNRPPTASGLMIRETLAEKCGRYVLVQVEASGNLTCRWRDKTNNGDEDKTTNLGKVTLPIHLRLVQKGKDIQVFTSADGQNWGEPRITHTSEFDSKGRLGLFVCSGNTFATTTAVFDSVEFKVAE